MIVMSQLYHAHLHIILKMHICKIVSQYVEKCRNSSHHKIWEDIRTD